MTICMRSALVAAVLVVSALSGGCNLYWHHTGGDDYCAEDDTAPLELRNPETGVCQDFTMPYCSPCEPCPAYNGAALPNWTTCFGPCEGLSEGACLATDNCHAAYLDGDAGAPPQFSQCWESYGPSGAEPAMTGACSTLDATACIRRDDCIHLFAAIGAPFEGCAPEPLPVSCDEATCAADSHCEQQCTGSSCRAYCVPDTLCAAIDCANGATCVETCDPATQKCTATCVAPTACGALGTEADCKLRTDCEAIYKGEDCTCTPDTCTCAIETYDHCQVRADPPN